MIKLILLFTLLFGENPFWSTLSKKSVNEQNKIIIRRIEFGMDRPIKVNQKENISKYLEINNHSSTAYTTIINLIQKRKPSDKTQESFQALLEAGDFQKLLEHKDEFMQMKNNAYSSSYASYITTNFSTRNLAAIINNKRAFLKIINKKLEKDVNSKLQIASDLIKLGMYKDAKDLLAKGEHLGDNQNLSECYLKIFIETLQSAETCFQPKKEQLAWFKLMDNYTQFLKTGEPHNSAEELDKLKQEIKKTHPPKDQATAIIMGLIMTGKINDDETALFITERLYTDNYFGFMILQINKRFHFIDPNKILELEKEYVHENQGTILGNIFQNQDVQNELKTYYHTSSLVYQSTVR